MSTRHNPATLILLFDLSSTSPCLLSRFLSPSKAPFWSLRKGPRFKRLRSDYPLYLISFCWSRFGLETCCDQVPQVAPSDSSGASGFTATSLLVRAVSTVACCGWYRRIGLARWQSDRSPTTVLRCGHQFVHVLPGATAVLGIFRGENIGSLKDFLLSCSTKFPVSCTVYKHANFRSTVVTRRIVPRPLRAGRSIRVGRVLSICGRVPVNSQPSAQDNNATCSTPTFEQKEDIHAAQSRTFRF